MCETQPFADLLRAFMRNGAGRAAWLQASAKRPHSLPVPEGGKPWNPKEIASACGVDVRTVQTWLARKDPQEPSDHNLSKLLAIFHGGRTASRQQQAFFAAARRQEQLRRLREARARHGIWMLAVPLTEASPRP
jgi:hypothetical protein